MSLIKCLLAVVFTIACWNLIATAHNGNRCNCAIMSSFSDDAVPVIEHTLNMVLGLTCEESAENVCRALCITVAGVLNSTTTGRSRFCKVLKKDIKIVPLLYSKVCGNFSYSGQSFQPPICCKNQEYYVCK